MTWILFWKTLFILALTTFSVMAVFVTVLGAAIVLSLHAVV